MSECFFLPQPIQQSLGIFILPEFSLESDNLSTAYVGMSVFIVSWDLCAVSLTVATYLGLDLVQLEGPVEGLCLATL